MNTTQVISRRSFFKVETFQNLANLGVLTHPVLQSSRTIVSNRWRSTFRTALRGRSATLIKRIGTWALGSLTLQCRCSVLLVQIVDRYCKCPDFLDTELTRYRERECLTHIVVIHQHM